MKVWVIGSGGWGTALALLLHRNGHEVTIWSHNEKKAEQLALSRENPLLKGVEIPVEIQVTGDISGLSKAQMAVFAAPSFALREVAHTAAPHLTEGTILVSVTKGIERGTHYRMSQVIREETGNRFAVAVLSGPSHAEEVARQLPTGCVAAAEEEEVAMAVQKAFLNKTFRVYTHDDVVGVELAGALKNVAALCCGVTDGFGFGDNTKALLITRAMAETARLAEKLGGRKETFAGLAGMGDLIVTCTSQHSRNRRAGMEIGRGKTPQDVLAAMGGVVEGYYAAQSAKELSDAMGVEMPICNAVYEVLYHGMQVAPVVEALMSRDAKSEGDTRYRWI